MARIVKQVSGKEKLTITGKIYQFGVQAPKDSIIIFNEDTNNKVVMGATEIFQAELDEGSYIASISVQPSNSNVNSYIDVIMEEGS